MLTKSRANKRSKPLEAGAVYGHLTVRERVYIPGKEPMYSCECVCGGSKHVPASSLRRGRALTCGECPSISRGRRRGPTDCLATNRLFRTYVRHASKTGRPFTLSAEEFFALIRGNCHYCGQRPSNCETVSYTGARFLYNGVDKVKPYEGYVSENCVSCCWRCNYAKRDWSRDEFLSWAARLAAHQDKLRG
jgi:hypothetical protein